MLRGAVSFEPPGLIPSLETNVRRLGRRAKKGFLIQTRPTVDAGKCNMRRSQMIRRLEGIPGSTAELGYQRNAFERIPKAAEPFEVVPNKIEPGRKLRKDSRQLSGFLQGPQRRRKPLASSVTCSSKSRAGTRKTN